MEIDRPYAEETAKLCKPHGKRRRRRQKPIGEDRVNRNYYCISTIRAWKDNKRAAQDHGKWRMLIVCWFLMAVMPHWWATGIERELTLLLPKYQMMYPQILINCHHTFYIDTPRRRCMLINFVVKALSVRRLIYCDSKMLRTSFYSSLRSENMISKFELIICLWSQKLTGNPPPPPQKKKKSSGSLDNSYTKTSFKMAIKIENYFCWNNCSEVFADVGCVWQRK